MSRGKVVLCLSLLACALGTAAPVLATEKLISGYYHLSFPTGDTKDWVDNDSWVGFSVEGRYFLKPNLSVGWLAGFNSLYARSFEVTQLGTFDVSGDQYRNLNAFPLMVTGHFYMGEAEGTRPFVGLGAGAYAMRQLLDVGAYTISTTEWNFGVAPELGVTLPVEWNSRVTINARYHYPFEGGTYLDGLAHSYPFLSFGVGYGRTY